MEDLPGMFKYRVSSQNLLMFFITSSYLYIILTSMKEIKQREKATEMIKKVFESKVQRDGMSCAWCLLSSVAASKSFI